MKIGLSLRHAVHDRHVDDRLLDIRARLLRVPGVANVAIWGERIQMLPGAGRARQAQANTASRSTGHGRHRGRARRGAAAVLRRRRHRHRAVSSRPRTSASPSGTCCPSSPRTTWRRCSSTNEDGKSAAPGRRGGRRGGPPAADRRRGHQRRPGPDADRREAAVGQHAPGHRGRRGRRWRSCAGPARHRVDTTIFRPATFIEDGDRQPHGRRCSSAACSWCWSSACSCRVADRADQRGRPSRCRSWRATWCCTGAESTINTMVLAGLVIALGRRRRRRHHRRREHRPPAASGQGRAGNPTRDDVGGPRGLAGGPQRDRLRHASSIVRRSSRSSS